MVKEKSVLRAKERKVVDLASLPLYFSPFLGFWFVFLIF